MKRQPKSQSLSALVTPIFREVGYTIGNGITPVKPTHFMMSSYALSCKVFFFFNQTNATAVVSLRNPGTFKESVTLNLMLF